ncbi:uncharacterized protein LOC143177355 [Calliopsis andreniformis]|uniref:uncharacterized protein LOC143177355 n=1 Tax=Calliopsis andreniformis TaxID=337506 RepID=UPI003FCD7349
MSAALFLRCIKCFAKLSTDSSKRSLPLSMEVGAVAIGHVVRGARPIGIVAAYHDPERRRRTINWARARHPCHRDYQFGNTINREYRCDLKVDWRRGSWRGTIGDSRSCLLKCQSARIVRVFSKREKTEGQCVSSARELGSRAHRFHDGTFS